MSGPIRLDDEAGCCTITSRLLQDIVSTEPALSVDDHHECERPNRVSRVTLYLNGGHEPVPFCVLDDEEHKTVVMTGQEEECWATASGGGMRRGIGSFKAAAFGINRKTKGKSLVFFSIMISPSVKSK